MAQARAVAWRRRARLRSRAIDSELGRPYAGRGRLTASARACCSAHTAGRDLALIEVLGGAGLRSHEARALPVDRFDQGRGDNHGGSVYLRVHGKGNKPRSVPLYSDVAYARER
jgi:site-specific recombinase XerD